MSAILSLECIDDDLAHAASRIGSMPPHVRRALLRRAPWVEAGVLRPWVERLLRDGSRQRCRCHRDYSRAAGAGSRGIFAVYALTDGAYEVCEIVASRTSRRYYIIVSGEETREVPREEAEEWARR